MLTHPTGLFRETIFWPLGALAPQLFTRPTSPINCISSRTSGAGRPQVGLCPIFLVVFKSTAFQQRDTLPPTTHRSWPSFVPLSHNSSYALAHAVNTRENSNNALQSSVV